MYWESDDAAQSDMSALFPSPERNKCYYIETNGLIEYSDGNKLGNGKSSILWNGTKPELTVCIIFKTWT